jgi:hypothetical protein
MDVCPRLFIIIIIIIGYFSPYHRRYIVYLLWKLSKINYKNWNWGKTGRQTNVRTGEKASGHLFQNILTRSTLCIYGCYANLCQMHYFRSPARLSCILGFPYRNYFVGKMLKLLHFLPMQITPAHVDLLHGLYTWSRLGGAVDAGPIVAVIILTLIFHYVLLSFVLPLI